MPLSFILIFRSSRKKKRLKSPSVKPLDLQMLTRFGVKVRVRTRVRYPLNKIL